MKALRSELSTNFIHVAREALMRAPKAMFS